MGWIGTDMAPVGSSDGVLCCAHRAASDHLPYSVAICPRNTPSQGNSQAIADFVFQI